MKTSNLQNVGQNVCVSVNVPQERVEPGPDWPWISRPPVSSECLHILSYRYLSPAPIYTEKHDVRVSE